MSVRYDGAVRRTIHGLLGCQEGFELISFLFVFLNVLTFSSVLRGIDQAGCSAVYERMRGKCSYRIVL